MAMVIDEMYEALDMALTELYWLHHSYNLPKTSKATRKAEAAGARFQKCVMRRRYRKTTGGVRKAKERVDENV